MNTTDRDGTTDETAVPDDRRNCYTCDRCGGQIVTIDLIQGVTPFMLRCRATDGCDGTMQSSFYRDVPNLFPSFEWFRPTTKELAAMRRNESWNRFVYADMKEHVAKGGLCIRPVTQVAEPTGYKSPEEYIARIIELTEALRTVGCREVGVNKGKRGCQCCVCSVIGRVT